MTMSDAQIAVLPYRPCVGVIVLDGLGRVLTGQRIDTQGEAWQMPQGGVEKGEDPYRAAVRELGEETGILEDKVAFIRATEDWVTYDLPADLVGKLWKGRYRGQKQLWFAFKFLGTDSDVNIATEIPEFRAWRWATRDQVVADIVPFKRDLYADVMGRFADLTG
ncbi:MAG: putative (di)nucleoside polyphosphate hydrolase [Paracoccaceae bacterium]|jgi:putative (di)nucleoside polyphosphate hydrolase